MKFKIPRAENSARLFTLSMEESKSLNNEVDKITCFIDQSAIVWANFAKEYAKR